MPKKSWKDLRPRTRRLIIAAGAFDATLRVIALVDLARRPQHEVRGPKVAWAAAITLVNSAGAVPALYLTRGRRR